MSLRAARLMRPVAAALAGALTVGLVALAPGPAAAGSSGGKVGALEDRQHEPSAVFRRSAYLCMGYAACREAGMGNAGYARANDQMYWLMYAGHNCTNYAAYRMVRSGLPNKRPWTGSGNATYWGTSVPRLTNSTPRVGAVAWWRANTGPAGSAGHVAYVERVVSTDEFIVSQDSWGGDFSWAVVTRGSGNWPSGFIHFNDRPLVNKVAPAIDGDARVGSVLSATTGRWRPTSVSLSYRWLADGAPIPRATGPTLRPRRARIGQRISVAVTASALGYPNHRVVSAPTAPLQPGRLSSVTPPQISGVAQVGSSLAVSPGTWSPTLSATELHYRWLADGQAVDDGDADPTRLQLGPDLVHTTVTAQVTATRSGYDPVTVQTAAAGPVQPGTFAVTTPPSLQGTPGLGRTLTVDPGAFAPDDTAVGVAVQWLRSGRPITGAHGLSYVATPEDLGSRIAARITLSRAGYESTSATTPRTRLVRSDPVIRVRTVPHRHRVRVRVVVAAPGVPAVTGRVVVSTDGIRRGLSLTSDSAGRVVTGLHGLATGEHSLTIRYAGSRTVHRGSKTRVVTLG